MHIYVPSLPNMGPDGQVINIGWAIASSDARVRWSHGWRRYSRDSRGPCRPAVLAPV